MARKRSEGEIWAQTQFESADLGDSRRTARLVQILKRAVENPSGKLSEVFHSPRELDGAYDFVERDQTSVEKLQAAVGRAAALQCVGASHVFVAVDGSSLTLIDRARAKGFGKVGSRGDAQGLKVMSALAVGADGATIGLLAQSWWAREAIKRSRKKKIQAKNAKGPTEKETRYWHATIQRAAKQLETAGTRGWFQLDREADSWSTLLTLANSGHLFTVRSAFDRVLQTIGGDKQYLRASLAATTPIGSYKLEVSGKGSRKARIANMLMRAATVTLRLVDRHAPKPRFLQVRVVWVREQGTTPKDETPLDWMLLTNAPINTLEAAQKVVLGYSMRWRIEEFHKTWKTGKCNVELTQLRSRNAVIRWATILAVAATRIERLKHLARTGPDRPATEALTSIEIEVLLVLKRRYKRQKEVIPTTIPTMGNAILWLAEIGGYTGKSSGGPPGSITIGRGLERLKNAVEGVLAMREAGR
jgi:hypothetical protein